MKEIYYHPVTKHFIPKLNCNHVISTTIARVRTRHFKRKKTSSHGQSSYSPHCPDIQLSSIIILLTFLPDCGGRGCLVVKASDHGWRVMSSSSVPLKTRRVGEQGVQGILKGRKHPLMAKAVTVLTVLTFNFLLIILLTFLPDCGGRGCLVVKASDHGWRVMSSSSVPLKTRRVGERCTLNPSKVQTSSR
ncbi:hypothetical protein TNCV_38821 [Trichonephila clavipes]|nr:hypothetical protein TNCV_38821 [Trichonephila clavipes]